MISDTAWVEEARRLREQGLSVLAISKLVCHSEYAIRRTLNINGTADKIERAKIERRTGPVHYVAGGRRSRAGQSAKGYGEPPAPRRISLPTLSILAKPIEDEKPAFRLAPKTHCRAEQPGVARWRDKHRELMRAGKVSATDREMQA